MSSQQSKAVKNVDEQTSERREEPRPRMTRTIVVSNGTVRHVVQVLMNGARMSAHPHINFGAHEHLVQQLRVAYERGDEDLFLATLKDYLEQAINRLPHAGRREDVEATMSDLRRLMHAYEEGFHETARYVLSSALAPVDRF